MYMIIDCFNTLIHMTTTLFSLAPQTDDILLAINELRESHAFLLCSHTYSYEEDSKKDQSSPLSPEQVKVGSTE